MPWAGGVYSIKRHGVSISNCDSEPVQTPGCIQAHGALLVLRPSDLTILQASENTLDHLGRTPEDLLGRSISTVVGSARETRLRAFLAKEPVDRNPLYVFTFPARADTGSLDVDISIPYDRRLGGARVRGNGSRRRQYRSRLLRIG